MKFIVGKKIEMTQVWKGDEAKAVTKVSVGPCTITQIKNEDKDGYSAVQISFGVRKEKNIKKPQLGHMKKAGVKAMRLREFRITKEEIEKNDLKIGSVINAGTFTEGDIVRVTGTSKGRGFQGVVKRHGFKGSKMTHGNKDQGRMPGSIGATGPAHVFKGTKMGGRMGGNRVTTTNLEIIEVDIENNIILISGAVPGARNGLILIKGEGELKVVESEKLKVESEKKVEDKDDKIEEKENKKESLKTLKKDEDTEGKKESTDAEAMVDNKVEGKK